MAKFNPDIPQDNPPSYLKYSTPIPEPQVDKSSAYLLEGAGDTISAALKGADTLAKEYIKTNIQSDLDKTRDQYTDDLETGKSIVYGDKAAQAASPSLIDNTDSAGKPVELSQFDKQLANTGSARANGKLSNTEYYGKLTQIAKSYRSQFPGYRDYIDSEISKVTGVNPANAYMTSVLGDINAAITNTQEKKNKAESWIESHAGILPPGALDGYRSGRYNFGDGGANDLFNIAQPRLIQDSQFDYNQKQRVDLKGSQDVLNNRAAQDATVKVGQEISRRMENFSIITNMNTPQNVLDLIDKIQSHAINPETGKTYEMDSQTATIIGRALQAERASAERSLDQAAYQTVKDKDGNEHTLISDMGPDGLNKWTQIKNAGLSRYDQWTQAVFKPESGMAFHSEQITRAAISDAGAKIFEKGDNAQYWQNLAAIDKHVGGQAAAQVIQQIYKNPEAFSNIDKEESAWVAKKATDLMNPENNYTFGQVLDQARSKPGTSKGTFQNLLNLPGSIMTNPKTPPDIQKSVFKATFGDSNQDILNKFMIEGSVDPSNPRSAVVGRYEAFKKFTSHEIAQKVVDMNKTDSTVMPQYLSTIEKMFGRDLFSQEIKQLRDIQLNYPDVRMYWSDGNHGQPVGFYFQKGTNINYRFQSNSNTNFTRTGIATVTQEMVASRTINRLNAGMSSLNNVAKAAGVPLDNMVFQFLVDSGYRPIRGGKSDVPQSMINSIANEYTKNKVLKEQD